MLHRNKRDDIDELLKRTGLWKDRNRIVSEYSKGMKTRLCFIISIFNSPSVLFLDEPMNGLNPEIRRVLSNIISYCIYENISNNKN